MILDNINIFAIRRIIFKTLMWDYEDDPLEFLEKNMHIFVVSFTILIILILIIYFINYFYNQ